MLKWEVRPGQSEGVMFSDSQNQAVTAGNNIGKEGREFRSELEGSVRFGLHGFLLSSRSGVGVGKAVKGEAAAPVG